MNSTLRRLSHRARGFRPLDSLLTRITLVCGPVRHRSVDLTRIAARQSKTPNPVPRRFLLVIRPHGSSDIKGAVRSTSVRAALVVICGVSPLFFGGCAGGGSSQPRTISEGTTCKEYLSRSTDERHTAAIRISGSVAGVPSGGNPLWGFQLDQVCSRLPELTLGKYFRNDR